jgi:hypothetical protein
MWAYLTLYVGRYPQPAKIRIFEFSSHFSSAGEVRRAAGGSAAAISLSLD